MTAPDSARRKRLAPVGFVGPDELWCAIAYWPGRWSMPAMAAATHIVGAGYLSPREWTDALDQIEAALAPAVGRICERPGNLRLLSEARRRRRKRPALPPAGPGGST